MAHKKRTRTLSQLIKVKLNEETTTPLRVDLSSYQIKSIKVTANFSGKKTTGAFSNGFSNAFS